MFSLNGAVKYKYIPNYQDMRGGYDKLCGVVRSLGENPEDGTAYVFTSKDQKVVKIIRHEHNECQMYYQKFDKGMSFVRLEFEGVINMSDMERKEYQDKIRELLGALTTMLDANKSMGERLDKANATILEANATISKANDEIEALKSRIAQLEGENAMRRRKTYGKNGEKSSPVADKGKTKDELEDEYIEREGKQPSADDDDDDEPECGAGTASSLDESSKLHNALTYMTGNWTELVGYVNVGTVQIDNNCCESQCKSSAIKLA